jgi:circadian clock protein KaiC
VEFNGERNRLLFVLKSRGMHHSNQVREFILSDKGITLLDAYLGAEGVLTGTARVAQEAREQTTAALRKEDHERKLRQIASKRKLLNAQIAALQAEAEAETAEVDFTISQENVKQATAARTSEAMAKLRQDARSANPLSKI